MCEGIPHVEERHSWSLPNEPHVMGDDDEACSEAKWIALHDEYFKAAGLVRPTRQQLQAFASRVPWASMGKWLMAQPTREQEVVYFATMVAPRTGPDVAIDVSQALNRLRGLDQEQGSNGHLSTFTTSTKLWLVRARRVISGRERLAMHGLSLRSWTKHASDSLLGDMAGNSFHAMAFIIALIASCRP